MFIIHLFKLNDNNVESVWINTDIPKKNKNKNTGIPQRHCRFGSRPPQ